MKNILIDVATITPGKGGSGGGIWTYAENLLVQLDNFTNKNSGIRIMCFVNKSFSLNLKNIQIIYIKFPANNIIMRMMYIHLILPLLCFFYRINTLHKLSSEVPFFLPCKLIVTIHDFMLEFYQQKGLNKNDLINKLKIAYFITITKRAVKKSTFIITPSYTIKKEIKEKFNIYDKVIVSELASKKFDIIASPNIKKNKTINLLCVAAFHKHKGHINLIEIFHSLTIDKPNHYHLYLRGNVSDRDFYQQVLNLIADKKLKNHITIIDYNKDVNFSDIYYNSDIFILLSEYEGFGLPLLEAQAHGIPIICSNIPIFKEVLNESAIFVNIEKKEQIVKEIIRLSTDDEKIETLKKSGFSNLKKYEWEKFAKKIYSVYTSS